MIVLRINTVRLLLWRGSAMASPGGKLSSEARLMRNGETDRFCIQFVKKVQLEKLYVLICLHPVLEKIAFLIRPCGAPSPRGKVWALPRQCNKRPFTEINTGTTEKVLPFA